MEAATVGIPVRSFPIPLYEAQAITAPLAISRSPYASSIKLFRKLYAYLAPGSLQYRLVDQSGFRFSQDQLRVHSLSKRPIRDKQLLLDIKAAVIQWAESVEIAGHHHFSGQPERWFIVQKLVEDLKS